MSRAKLNKKQLEARKQISVIGAAPEEFIKIYRQVRRERLRRLENLGLIIRNKGTSVYLNRISPGCYDCSRGTGLTIATTKECNRNCYFCFYPGPSKDKIKLLEAIKEMRTGRALMLSFAITGGECLLELNATLDILDIAKKIAGNICQTRIYTNGDMLNRSVLKKLRAAKLDEIRISIKPDKKQFKAIALAKEYIPRVMVETPVFPDEEEMKNVLLKLNNLGIFGVNLLEFVFSCRNAQLYKKRGYKLVSAKVNDFSQPYPYDYPVYGSEETCLNLLEFSAKENLTIGVHYCSFKNKQYGNHTDKSRNIEISKNIRAEFMKNPGCNKQNFIFKYWIDRVLDVAKPW